MNTLLKNSIIVLFTTVMLVAFSSCGNDDKYLYYALKTAGKNKTELIAVLKHYRTVDKDPLKLKAAKYLIANMPCHYSYSDTAMANRYYSVVLKILKSGKDAGWQRDTIRQISNCEFPGMASNIVSDVKVMTAEYLIYSIDHAFSQWRTRPWAQHLTYEEFRDWLLPYKVTELQKFDHWRDTLSAHFSDSISHLPIGNEQCSTIFGALDIVRNEMVWKLKPYIAWTTSSGHPLLSAETMANMTYGSCLDYVTLGTAVFRSVGLPATIDNVPIWGRNHEGHTWFTELTDNGREVPTQNDISFPAGWGFYPYQRFPKIYRKTYAINEEVLKYQNTTKYKYPFEVCKEDVTTKYYRTSDVSVDIWENVKLKDKYVYIATLANKGGPAWYILDFGTMKKRKACFKNVGREILYLALGYNGSKLVPISDPFVLNKDGSITYEKFDDSSFREIEVRRKYYESYNVVEQRRKILGAMIQCSDNEDFKDAITLYTVDSLVIPDKIILHSKIGHKYWRYLSKDGTFGSIAELAFYDVEDNEVKGIPIACKEASEEAISRAFDNDWLSNFETESPNGNWVGMHFETDVVIKSVRIIPRSDDNDVCPGNEYELLMWNGREWLSLGNQIAKGNTLQYENIPKRCILWLKNHTRGWAERPFIISDDGVEWY